jgi:negative regulator of replication initiation
MYYQHQYDRVAKLEEQGLNITNVVMTFSVVAFTFGFDKNQGSTAVTGVVLPLTMIAANVFAITYLISSGDWIETHRSRAERILELFAEDIYRLDREFFNKRKIRFWGRRRTQLFIHGLLMSIAVVPMLIYLRSINIF